jgi:hypothetical protein
MIIKFVFTNLNGEPMAPDRLTRIFKTLAAQAGLPSAARAPFRDKCRPERDR